MTKTFIGQIIHTTSLNNFVTFPNGFIAVDGEKIVGIGNDYDNWKKDWNKSINEEIVLKRSEFLMPGFVDCHLHAPQFPQIGLGLDKPLLGWLQTYTFPLESQYNDDEFARNVYNKVVKATIDRGTTLASYFATIHKNSSVILAKEIIKQGQKALVGKVCSDCNCPDFYIETLENSIADTESFVKEILDLKSSLVKPTITPRFAVSCTEPLLKGLAEIATKYQLNIQSHISENLSEIEFVKSIFGKSYGEIYNSTGLLNSKCIMAHAVHLEDEEIELFKKTGASIAHCPASNTMLSSGLCDVKRLLNAGITVGLGTDVAGGNHISIHDAILRAMDVSHHIEFIKKRQLPTMLTTISLKEDIKVNNSYTPLTYKEAIYLATLGGAQALGFGTKTGNFECGKFFDALLINVDNVPILSFDMPVKTNGNLSAEDRLSELVQKFIYTGDDRNIRRVYVNGKQIK